LDEFGFGLENLVLQSAFGTIVAAASILCEDGSGLGLELACRDGTELHERIAGFARRAGESIKARPQKVFTLFEALHDDRQSHLFFSTHDVLLPLVKECTHA
jgi:hypothetical protein